MSKFISFSGLDGSGKSTQIRIMSNFLRQAGINCDVIYSRFGRTTALIYIKRILLRILKATEKLSSNSFRAVVHQIVFAAYRMFSFVDIFLQYTVIYRIKSIHKDIILCDRYIWDSYVDASVFPQMINLEDNALWKLLVRVAPKTSHSICIQVSPELANSREQKRKEVYIEPFVQTRARFKVYSKLVFQNRFDLVVDGNAKSEEIFSTISNCLFNCASNGKSG